MNINCDFCEKELDRSESRIKKYKHQYCGDYCKNQHQKVINKGSENPNYKNSISKICTYCGKEYNHYSKNRKFCSHECYAIHRKKEFVCNQCNKTFLDSASKHSSIKGVFCSIDCYKEFCTIQKTCEYCNKIFFVKKTLSKQKFCSVDCLTKIRKRDGWSKGSNNARWLGGKSGFRGSDWREQRLKALERDGGACQICGKQDGVAVHHIIPWRIKSNNDVRNLITLCRKHHTKEENYYRQFGKISNFMLDFVLNNKTEVVNA